MAKNHVEFQNGQKMPILGFGTSQVDLRDDVDREELVKGLNDALTAGYRHIDTAYLYNNEHIIGDVLCEWLTSGKIKREELFIVTKLPPIGMDESRVEHFLKRSLAALQLDYVDLYLLHCAVGLKYIDDVTLAPTEGDKMAWDMTTDHLKIWKAMEAQVAAGRTKAIGLSNFNSKQIDRIVESAEILPANFQLEAHIYFQQKPLRETCKKHGITVCAYGPLGCPGRIVFNEKTGRKVFQDLGLLNDPLVKSIAAAHGKSSAQILLRFLIQSDIVVIPKSTNTKRIYENFDVFDFNLSTSEMTQLQGLDKGEAGRIFTYAGYRGIQDHPELPYAI